jgi:solute carrier family 25 ornithine transporter 2/15
MFIGFDSQIMRDAPFYAVFFGGYELNCYLFRTYVPSMPDELNFFLRQVASAYRDYERLMNV